jgi:hypothetical protein
MALIATEFFPYFIKFLQKILEIENLLNTLFDSTQNGKRSRLSFTIPFMLLFFDVELIINLFI